MPPRAALSGVRCRTCCSGSSSCSDSVKALKENVLGMIGSQQKRDMEVVQLDILGTRVTSPSPQNKPDAVS